MAAVATIEASSAHVGDGDSDVARAAAGDRTAFEQLYRQHVNRVFSLCARMVADRTRYFRTHKKSKQRAAFVRLQSQQLKALQKRLAKCS